MSKMSEERLNFLERCALRGLTGPEIAEVWGDLRRARAAEAELRALVRELTEDSECYCLDEPEAMGRVCAYCRARKYLTKPEAEVEA